MALEGDLLESRPLIDEGRDDGMRDVDVAGGVRGPAAADSLGARSGEDEVEGVDSRKDVFEDEVEGMENVLDGEEEGSD